MSDRVARAGRKRACAAVVAALVVTAGAPGRASAAEQKVPFGNKPCQSLSSADQATLGMNAKVAPKPDRAPATLPMDNLCFYGGLHVGYMTKADYDLNGSGNRSTERQGPGDLPGAFYDKQGGLWFAKGGYYVVVAGSRRLVEPAARAIVNKL